MAGDRDLARLLAGIVAGVGADDILARCAEALAVLAPDACVELELHGDDPVVLRHGRDDGPPVDVPVGACGRLRSRGLVDPGTLGALGDVLGASLAAHQALADARAELEAFREDALHDALTGLPNRVLLVDRIDQALARSRRTGRSIAVIFCDLDRFKQVNDTYGHAVGDALLVAFAGRFRALLRPGDTAARLGGDEFVVLCDDLAGSDEAEGIADRLARAMSDPFALAAGSLQVKASFGVVSADPTHHSAAALLEDADAAMYRAKRQGGAQVAVIDLRDGATHANRRALAGELRSAIGAGAVDVAYDPIVQSTDGRPVSVEVVPVWRRGPEALAAADLRSLAVEAHVAAEMWHRVLRTACTDRSRWAEDGHRTQLSVDVGVPELLAPGFAASVAQVLDSTGTEAGVVTLELPERSYEAHREAVRPVLGRLKQLGLGLAVDCYGTGRASLGVLRDGTFDEVKLDAHMVDEIADPAGHATAFATIELAHLLGMVVVAEGVDSDAELEAVTMLGCDLSQGRHFTERLSSDGVGELLRASVD